jgi:hypothetical protein
MIINDITGTTRTFVEEVAGALDSKEFYLVEQGTADNSVKLLTASIGNVIGVFYNKLQAGELDVNIRMLGRNGTFKVKMGGVAAQGDKLIGASGGKAVKLPTTPGKYRVIGRKLTYGNSANNDVVECSDQPEWVVVPTVVALGNVNGVIGALNSTAVNPTKSDFDALLAATETLADDARAIHAALVTAGIVTAS